MKQFLFCFIALCLSFTTTYAQSASCNNVIKSISITDNSGYVIPYNTKDAAWTTDLNENMVDKIWDLYHRDIGIKQIEIQSDGDYVMLWGKNDASWTGVPDELSDKILELNEENRTIKSVSLRDDDAFVILWDRNDAMWTNSVPQNLKDKILELHDDNEEIKQVAMNNRGEYILLWGRNQAQWTVGVPQKLKDKILKLYNDGNRIDYVELTNNNEFVIVWDNNHSYFSNGIPDELKTKLRDLACHDSDFDDVTPPTITWTSPNQSASYVTNDNKQQTISACIKAEGNLEEVKLYLNGRLYDSKRDFVIRKKNNGNSCTLDFQKSIYLSEGKNTIYIVAANEGGQTTSYTRTITVKEKVIVNNDDVKPQPLTPSRNDRVALIIGNANYDDVNARLKNPKNDADAMETKLKTLGFKTIKITDANKSTMRAKIREFGEALKENKVGLFYYAGHGFQIEGKNYLVPVDAHIADQADAEDACVSVDYILAKMEVSNTETNLVILDACRNNPFRSWMRSSNSGGLISVSRQPKGSLIAFATQPGNVAADGNGSNGVYTSAWLKHLQPGKNIFEVLTNINGTVSTASGEKQVPWFNSSLQASFVF